MSEEQQAQPQPAPGKKKKKVKVRRPKAEAPRGFRDSFAAEVLARREMLGKITEVYHRYGFDPLETSAIEYVESLGKFLPDVDRPMGGIFGWQDDDEQWVALRYDLTAPLARVAAQYRNDLPNPYRRYAVGPVWRNEKPGPGRFREFYQCDADTVGSPSVAADAEICAMLSDALEAAGVARGDYLVRVNNRKVLNGVLERIKLLDPADPEGDAVQLETRMTVLRAIDKLDKFGTEGVRLLLGAGRKDESGDFTKGAGLSDEQIAIVIGFMEAERAGAAATCAELKGLTQGSMVGAEGVAELEQIGEMLEAQGYGADRIKIDPSVVRGLGYYTGPVYEAELTFEILDEKGRPRQFGSVSGGGRYDDLVKRFTGQAVPATGASIGVDRLLAALKMRGQIREDAAQGPVVILALDREQMPRYQRYCAELRNAGIRAEVYLGGAGNMAKQVKYADKRQSPIAVIEGELEREQGIVQLKDLILGAKLAQEIESNEEWKAQPAQISVKAEDLVAETRKMLARHGLQG
ncbi:MAG: histidine--tRNA ligase [Neomegalonema sp.]|nr:histidine--tRNA ligase [Neomegalonema sp.]